MLPNDPSLLHMCYCSLYLSLCMFAHTKAPRYTWKPLQVGMCSDDWISRVLGLRGDTDYIFVYIMILCHRGCMTASVRLDLRL